MADKIREKFNIILKHVYIHKSKNKKKIQNLFFAVVVVVSYLFEVFLVDFSFFVDRENLSIHICKGIKRCQQYNTTQNT